MSAPALFLAQLCTGIVILCFVAFILWALRNQPPATPSQPSQYTIPASRLDDIPHHGEMQAAHVAAAVNQNLSGHGQPVCGDVHVYRDDAHEVQSNAAWLEAHGRDGDNRVSVIRHAGRR